MTTFTPSIQAQIGLFYLKSTVSILFIETELHFFSILHFQENSLAPLSSSSLISSPQFYVLETRLVKNVFEVRNSPSINLFAMQALLPHGGEP